MKHWYFFKSKDGKLRGYCSAETELEVARFAGYALSELIIKAVKWNGGEFVEELR